MRVLELITLGEVGGAQTVLVDLVKGLSGQPDLEIDVATGPGEYLPQALQPWFKGELFPLSLRRKISPLEDLQALFKLIQICRRKKYQIIHCHSSKAALLGKLAAKLAGIPIVYVTVHGLSFYSGTSKLINFLYKGIEKIFMPWASQYIFVSPADMSEMLAMGLEERKARLIPNGRPVPDRPQKGLKALLGVPEDVQIICMIARLAQIKNPLAFIELAKEVMQRWPQDRVPPRFVLIGDGPLLEECKERVVTEGLTDWVYLTGALENAGQYLWEADLAVLTSHYEACPLAAIEAMAAGVPVIATDVGGTSGVVRHGETGYLYPHNRETEAAELVISLLINRLKLEEFRANVKRTYVEKFSIERMVQAYRTLFQERNQ